MLIGNYGLIQQPKSHVYTMAVHMVKRFTTSLFKPHCDNPVYGKKKQKTEYSGKNTSLTQPHSRK